MGYARKAYDKAKTARKAARSKGKPAAKGRTEYDPKSERIAVRAMLKDYRAAA